MASVKQHLQKLHEDSVAHHEAAAEHHRTLAKCFKAEGGLESAEDIAAAHEGLAKSHDKMAANHEAMSKAVGADDLSKADQLVPDRISGVITHFPGITPIPRYGAPDRSQKANVSVEFEKLVSVEEDL
jgi:hypothetical protein